VAAWTQVKVEARRTLEAILLALEEALMAGQASIDNAVDVLDPFFSNLVTVIGEVKAELASGQAVDTSKLDAIVAQVPGIQTQVDALVPSSPGTTATTSTTATAATSSTTRT
jgi:hypothetical protein